MNAHGARRLDQIESGREIEFTFDGSPIIATLGDTIASALIAAGHGTFGYSAHDGSPYGGFCFVGRCAECLVIVNGQPGVFACTTHVEAGMTAETQHGLGRWGNEAAS